ncbi:hypothetical protein D3C79_783400 [compost metagenome]
MAATGPVDRDREQRQADRGDHRTGDQGREKAHDLGHERRDQHAEEPGGDGRPEDPLQAHTGHAGHGHHAADGSETGAHHYRHADPHGADTERLDDGGNACDQQVGVDQERDFFARQTGGLADDQWHGNRASVHQQHVLQAYQNQLEQGQRFSRRRNGNVRLA